MNEKLNKFIYEDCGLYISPENSEATRKEIEFVCEQLIKEILKFCKDAYPEHLVHDKFGVRL